MSNEYSVQLTFREQWLDERLKFNDVGDGWTTDDLVFLWKEGDPVQVVKNLHLPRFTLEKFLTDYCNSKTNTGEYSCLKVDLLFKREFSYYLIQIYIPCCMLVIVSWVSFWLDQGAVPARVSLGELHRKRNIRKG
uniref:Neurotransmitter-gated ion-channel transmembrane domain-containing protein n=1 Tax=Lutzomyia longipalpis TaxID=7200 RepID=A0A1B0CER2_LUTLO